MKRIPIVLRCLLVLALALASRLPAEAADTWEMLPGAVRDIGIGGGGSVWSIGTNATVGGFRIYKWNGNAWGGVDGGAARIDVDPSGNPWIVNGGGNIFRREATSWILLPGLAKDIGVGANGAAWIVGTNPSPGGFGIYRWTGTTWQGIDGGAVRIDVDPRGNPWVVNSEGAILRREGNRWIRLPGAARDIGIGADGTVWIVGTNATGGGFGIFRWLDNDWQKIDGGGTEISVDPKGAPWVVNADNNVFRRTQTESATARPPVNPATKRDCGTGDDPGCGEQRDGRLALDAERFSGLIAKLKATDGDQNRKNALIQGLQDRHLTAKQFMVILDFLASDIVKVEVAREFSRQVIDPKRAISYAVKIGNTFLRGDFVEAMSMR